jgi:hypothetical protein
MEYQLLYSLSWGEFATLWVLNPKVLHSGDTAKGLVVGLLILSCIPSSVCLWP